MLPLPTVAGSGLAATTGFSPSSLAARQPHEQQQQPQLQQQEHEQQQRPVGQEELKHQVLQLLALRRSKLESAAHRAA